jgi:hypothetical protein
MIHNLQRPCSEPVHPVPPGLPWAPAWLVAWEEARAPTARVSASGGAETKAVPAESPGIFRSVAWGRCAGPPPAALLPPWNQAEADRLLTELREAVARARRDFGSPFPAALQAVVADGLTIAEGYVANHEAEARRGWDALQLLRKVRPWLLGVIDRVKRSGEGGR